MPKLIGAAAVIVNELGHVLLVKHSYGKLNWEIPGGKGEENESAEQTAEREVLEEIGIEIKVNQLTGVYYEAAHDMHHFVFKADLNGLNPTPNSPEIVECGFFAVDKLPRPISEWTEQRILDTLDEQRSGKFHTIGPRIWLE